MGRDWALRLLSYPNALVSIIGLLGTYALYQSFSSHDEHSFSSYLNLLNGLLLLAITYFSLTIIQNPLRERLRSGPPCFNILTYN
jgi:hypothetical protein